jgi:hypothetical protein
LTEYFDQLFAFHVVNSRRSSWQQKLAKQMFVSLEALSTDTIFENKIKSEIKIIK